MTDPIKQFEAWLKEAKADPSILEPTAMTLATASSDGVPSARMVLLKGLDARGFVFYTNMESRKSEELAANPRAALCFFWKGLLRQVRVEGPVERVSEREADAYFTTRPLGARIGAIASKQSRVLASREALVRQVEELSKRYDATHPPPRPANWSGWRVVPGVIEFWQEGDARLHDRERFTRQGNEWKIEKLYP
jgi:pyridoxamine 5'-phosphate oxidase